MEISKKKFDEDVKMIELRRKSTPSLRKFLFLTNHVKSPRSP